MLYGGGRAFSYTAFNVPNCIESSATAITTCVAGSANTETFFYDSEHRRSQQISSEGTTIYINAGGVLTEKFTPVSGAVQWRSYLSAGGVNIGMYVRTVGGSPAPYTRYFHPDHLGSVSAITNDAGSSVEQDAYDPWGKRRNLNGTDDTGDTLGSLTNRGYTFQEFRGHNTELTDQLRVGMLWSWLVSPASSFRRFRIMSPSVATGGRPCSSGRTIIAPIWRC
jgi:hypothetical protein